MTIDAERIPTFAFHINGWKRAVFKSFFPERRFTYLPMHLSDEVFEEKWMARIAETPGAEIFVWSQNVPKALEGFVRERAIPCHFIEDGFLRSNRPNAARTPPLSLALDSRRPYFDSRGPSDLEVMLETHDFSADPALMERARAGIRLIVEGGLSKYNMASSLTLADLLGPKTKPRVLVIGQVEDDASIRFGAGAERGNLALLQRVRAENPQARLIYKPHPDVEAGLRPGAIAPADLAQLADLVAHRADPVTLLDQVDAVWTITSTLGFEALLRGLSVTTLGAPFYAGWGLTRDLGPVPPRRQARPGLAAFVHACLIAYPRYFDPVSGLPCPPELALDRLADPSAARGGPALRILAKAQGLLSGHAWLWRS